jgi:hypothetical protein
MADKLNGTMYILLKEPETGFVMASIEIIPLKETY